MLTQEDKHWIEGLLDQRFKLERELMRDFITEGRRQDRAWAEHFQDDFACTVAIGFNEVHAHITKLEHPQTVPLF